MEKLVVLGTGRAMVTKCYNTCFTLFDGQEHLLVDAGGGNGIMTQLEQAAIPYTSIKNAFLSHCHTDHVLGMVWMIRKVTTMMLSNKYHDIFTIYSHAEAINSLKTLCHATLVPSMINLFGNRVRFVAIDDGETAQVGAYALTFFSIHSKKMMQFGFSTQLLNGKKLAFMGDEPLHPLCHLHAQNSDWLLHEAFCLYEDRERFRPYEKHHSTVREACQNAATLGAKNIILWHTEDSQLSKRRMLYTQEGKPFFNGNILVPDDLDEIAL